MISGNSTLSTKARNVRIYKDSVAEFFRTMANRVRWTRPFVEDQYYVLDGGLSTQLSKYVQGVDEDPLWTARSLVKDEASLVKAHRDFLSKGARIILTNSYQISTDSFKLHLGSNERETYSHIVNSARLAWKAVKEEGCIPGHVLVGGSVGPYGACQHDGSEYTGAYLMGDCALSHEELVDWHKNRIEALEEGGVSFIAIETMPASREALAAMDCVIQNGMLSAWVSFTLKDGCSLAGGETVEDAVKAVMKHELTKQGKLLAVGFNCSAPKFITEALTSARKVAGKVPFVVYPNSGESWSGTERGWSGEGQDWLQMVSKWVKLGAIVVGGCCRVGAETLPKIEQHIIQGIIG